MMEKIKITYLLKSCFVSTRAAMVGDSFKTTLAFFILVISSAPGIESAVSCPSGDTAGIIKDGQTCSQLISSANYECYDSTIETSCCASCNDIAGTNAECLYGDRQSNCFVFACPSYVNISDCCDTCVTTTSSASTLSTVTSSSTSSNTSTMSTSTSSSTTSATTTSPPVGAIVGGVVGGVAGVSLVTAGVIAALKLKKPKRNKVKDSEDSLSVNLEKKRHALMNGPIIETNILDEKVDSSIVTDTKFIDESNTQRTTIRQTSTPNTSTDQDETVIIDTMKSPVHNEPVNVVTDERPMQHETVNDVTDKPPKQHEKVNDVTDKPPKQHETVNDVIDKPPKQHGTVSDVTDKPPKQHGTVNDVANGDLSVVQNMNDASNPQGNQSLFTKLPPIMLEPKFVWDD